MKRLISLSLYGSDPIYLQGALRNVRLQKVHFPTWTTRIYASQEIPATLIEQLKAEGAEVVAKVRQNNIDGMFWRFLPVGEPDVDAVIVRDTDSRLTARERAAVDQWIDSGKSLHIMRDHPLHRVVMLGGMWGCRGGKIPDINELLGQWNLAQKKGYDQDFLNDKIYPRFSQDCFIHSELYRYQGEQVHPFPVPRDGGEFIGCVYDADRDTLTPEQHAANLASFTDTQLKDLPRAQPRSMLFRSARQWLRVLRGKAAA
ncbi:hypothetical protein [Celeribacter sp.]|uniref:hypothetical protein n=1 Tax=Celeribacter sp. TaxID=1890673 RepID=UPI003A956950